MTIRKVPLKEIRPNPWQARMDEDPAHVEEVAASIQAEGLLQNPGGRLKGDKVELCFGATRWAAFKWLAAHREVRGVKYDPDEYVTMPVDVRARTDLEMFEQAIAENEQREDLSPIERAAAIQRYMTEFGASRDQAGRLFGLQGSSVSNVVALLDLSPTLRDMVHKGELPERTARMFVHLSRLSPKRADEIGKDLRRDKEQDPDRIAHRVAEAMSLSGRLLMRGYDRGKVDGKWWELGATIGITDPTPGMAARCLGPIYPTGTVPGPAASLGAGSTVAKAAREILRGLKRDKLTPRELIELHGWPAQAVEVVAHLVRPPACTACEYRMVLRGDHYCAMKACYEAKLATFRGRKLEQVRKSKPLAGIPIYARTDGKALAAPGGHTYYGKGEQELVETAFKQALKGKHEDLRVRGAGPSFYGHEHFGTKSEYAELVAVGPLATAITEALQRQQEATGQRADPLRGNMRETAQWNEVVYQLRHEAARHFATIFGGMKGTVLTTVAALRNLVRMPWDKGDPEDEEFDVSDDLLDEEGEPALKPDMPEAEREDTLRLALAGQVLAQVNPWGIEPHVAAQAITALAAPGGAYAYLVRLPADWADEILAAYDKGEIQDPEAEAADAADAELEDEGEG